MCINVQVAAKNSSFLSSIWICILCVFWSRSFKVSRCVRSQTILCADTFTHWWRPHILLWWLMVAIAVCANSGYHGNFFFVREAKAATLLYLLWIVQNWRNILDDWDDDLVLLKSICSWDFHPCWTWNSESDFRVTFCASSVRTGLLQCSHQLVTPTSLKG